MRIYIKQKCIECNIGVNAMDKHMNIVIGSSKELALFSMVTLKSLFVNNKDEIFDIWFYFHERMDETIEKIEALVLSEGSKFHPMFISEYKSEVFSVGNMDWWHTSIWYRYYCIDDLYGYCDRALILGTDVVVQKKIRDFYEEEIGDKCIKAVLDMGYFNKYPTEWHKKYNIDKYGYVNTDVVLIDLNKAHGVISATKMFGEYFDKKLWALDQDVINACYRDELFVCTDMYYNYIPVEADKAISNNENNEKIGNAVFLHFAVIKPWNEYVKQHHHDIWFRYADQLDDALEFTHEVIKHMGDHISKEKRRFQECITEKNSYIYKMDILYWIYDKFFSACVDGTFKNNIESLRANRIAVYGYGKLGKQLRNYLNSCGIEIDCFIENNERNNEEIHIKSADNLSNDDYWDVIIVTPIYDYQNIENMIKEHCKRVISIEKLV